MTPGSAWRIYDPRIGGDRVFAVRLGETVSSLAHNTWVLETETRDWSCCIDLLDKAFVSVPGYAYATCLVWSVNARNLMNSLVTHGREILPGLWLLSLEDAAPVTAMMNIRAACGAAQSGLWSVGVADSVDSVEAGIRAGHGEVDSPILLTARLLGVVSCALCLDDGLDMVFVREHGSVALFVDRIADRLHRVSPDRPL